MAKICCCCSSNNEIQLTGVARQAVEFLSITQKDLKKMKECFDDTDIDGSNEIDYTEFAEMVKEPRSPYLDALFQLTDLDGSGTVSFDEFVQVMIQYCMYSKEEILKFVFDTFDKDGSGALDEEEFMMVCTIVNNGSPTFPGNFGRALEEFDSNDDGMIDFDEFRELNRRYPMVLFPAFRLQDRMQKQTLGEWRWAKIFKNHAKERVWEEYRKAHNGKLPKAALWRRIIRKIFFCCSCTQPAVDRYQQKYERIQAEMKKVRRKKTAKTANVDWKENTVEWK